MLLFINHDQLVLVVYQSNIVLGYPASPLFNFAMCDIPCFHSSSQSTLCLRTNLCNLGLNRRFQCLRLRRTSPPAYNFTILVHKKLLKIPLHPLQPHQAWFLLLQPLPDRVGTIAIDVDFAEHGECDTVVDAAEGLDVVVATGVLGAKLVTGKADNFEGVCILSV